MQRPHLVGAAIGFVGALTISSTSANASSCTNVLSLQLEHTTITSATDNTSGVFVVPGTNPPQTISNLPAFCRVTATLTPTADSVIKIEAWLPEGSAWNGRFLGTGGGGFQGVITYSELAAGIQGGFASTNSDLGTGVNGCNPLYCGSDGVTNPLSTAFGEPPTPTIGLFGHPERIKDFGHRAIHQMTLRGKEIADAFYQQKHTKAYFAGCSTGGQNALMEAQRFPHDYDGILAGAPAYNRTHLHMGAIGLWQATHVNANRFILPGQMTLINKAVIAQCVGQDGGAKTDQFLTDPRDCHFDPQALQCTGGNVPPACLSADQVTTMRTYYDGTRDPVTGQLINPGYERGNETDNVVALGLALQENLPEPAFDGLFYWVYGSAFGMPGTATNFANFDFHKDVDTVDRQLEKPLNATSTDLGEFREHGGKLILYHGWADPLIPSQTTINYFNALVDGDSEGLQPARFERGDPNLKRTQSYARLFMVPGMYHCSGGPGPNTFDALTPLVNWVEKGTAPDTIVATKFVNDTPPTVAMTRPLCVYPKVAKYNGSGNASAAANFTCVTDESDFNQTPAPKFGP